MGKLLFTEDELYSNRPYDVVEDEERPKAEAIKQCRYNNSALKWLHTVYYENAERELTCEEVMSHPVTIADAFKFYADFMRKRHAEHPTYETQQLLNDAHRGESVCSMILLQRKNLKMILWDYAVIQVAEKALKCWNDVLPYKNEQEQPQQTPPPAGDREPINQTIDREQNETVAFKILQEQYETASEQDRKQYFLSKNGRPKKGFQKQEVYFEPAREQFNTANNGALAMGSFIKIVRRFKKTLKNG